MSRPCVSFASLASFLLLLAHAGAWSQSGPCGDAFAGPALDPAWSFLDADGEAGGSARIANGRLELAGKGRDAFKDVNEFVGVRRLAAFAGDFDVSVKLESQSRTHGWAQAGILAANSVLQPAKGGYAVVDVTPDNGYHAFYDGAGSQGTLDAHYDAGVTAYPVWIRLARSGNRFTAWYKNQASGNWTAIGASFQALGTGPASEIALVSLSHNDTLEAKAVFDDFACAGTVTSMLPWRPDRAPGPGRGVSRAFPGLRIDGAFSGASAFDAAGRSFAPAGADRPRPSTRF